MEGRNLSYDIAITQRMIWPLKSSTGKDQFELSFSVDFDWWTLLRSEERRVGKECPV